MPKKNAAPVHDEVTAAIDAALALIHSLQVEHPNHVSGQDANDIEALLQIARRMVQNTRP